MTEIDDVVEECLRLMDILTSVKAFGDGGGFDEVAGTQYAHDVWIYVPYFELYLNEEKWCGME